MPQNKLTVPAYILKYLENNQLGYSEYVLELASGAYLLPLLWEEKMWIPLWQSENKYQIFETLECCKYNLHYTKTIM